MSVKTLVTFSCAMMVILGLNNELMALTNKTIQSSYNTDIPQASNISNQDSQDITIKSAWEKVVANNDGLKAGRLGVESTEKLRLGAKLSYLPQIDINALYLHLGEKVQLDLIHDRAKFNELQNTIQQIPAFGSQLSPLLQMIGTPITLLNQNIVVGALNIVYPIYTGGARYYGNKLAEIAKKDAKEALRLKELATFEELVQIYYAVVLNAEIVEVLEATQKSALTHYQNAQKLHKRGQIADIELLGSQVAYDKAKNKSLAAQNVLEVAQLTLDSVLQSEHNIPTSPLQISQDMELKSLQYYIDSTLQSYPALKIAHNKTESSKQTHKLEFGSFMPKVGAFASFVITDNQSKLEQMMPNYYLGLTAQWSLITPLGRLQKYQATKILQLQANALESQAIKDMKLLVKKTYKQAIFYKQEYENLNSSIALAKENLRLQEKAFAQGIATNDSVVDARNALAAVMTEQKGVAYKAIIAFAKLEALSGNTDEFFQIQK